MQNTACLLKSIESYIFMNYKMIYLYTLSFLKNNY